MYAKNVSDPEQGRHAGVHLAGLNVLIGLPAHGGGEEHGLLGSVLADSFDADAVADRLSAFEEPGVVVGQAGHPLDT